MFTRSGILRTPAMYLGLILPLGLSSLGIATLAQAPAAATALTRQSGTVKAISGNSVTLATDGGAQVSVSVTDGAKVLQVAPGSTDLKSAQQIALTDVAVGDRILVTGKAGDDGGFTASRVILMKSTDIAEKNAAEKADWQKRGSGGLVSLTIVVNGVTFTFALSTTPGQTSDTGTVR